MSKNRNAEELQQILTIISNNPNGITLEDIFSALNTKIQKRTLQRRLTRLKTQNLIVSQGQARATRYYPANQQKEFVDLAAQGYIKISSAGESIKNALSQPISARLEAKYNPEFLSDYQPNKTFYLSPEIRRYLISINDQNTDNYPAGTFAKNIFDRLLIDLSWNSSRLEGNTYSLLDTERLIHQGKAAEGKELFETRMILNHKAAIEFLLEQAEDLTFNKYIILNLHALLSKNLLADPTSQGKLRTAAVGIAKTTYQPITIPQLIEQYFMQLLKIINKIKDPFEQSFFSMVHLPYLQPFVDVNKRVSRLAANIPLIQNNLSPISFVDVPKQAYIDGILGVYELNKTDLLADVYVWAYEKSTLRYCAAQAYYREPDVFLEKYEQEMQQLILLIVTEKQNKEQASYHIDEWTKKHIPTQDQDRFKEIIETHLLTMHEGNIANYKIKPEQFLAWQKQWLKRT